MEELLKELVATGKLIDWDMVTDAIVNSVVCSCDREAGICARCVQINHLNALAQALCACEGREMKNSIRPCRK